MTSQSNSKNTVKHSEPITINTAFRGPRPRSFSVSSSSSGSASSGSDVQTPPSPSLARITVPSPGNSPILSYFLTQPPKTPNAVSTFPSSFKRFGQVPVFEADEEPDVLSTVQAHTRRASATGTVSGRFANQPTSFSDKQHERGAGLLRRLSLGSAAFSKAGNEPSLPPSPPPNTAVPPTPVESPFSVDKKPKRAATLGVPSRPRRAPSPMGERILKGHFDGFN